MPDFGERIRHLRKKRGLTIMDVEKATGIGHSTISRWERGESVPNSSDIYRILMDYFKVDMCYLLGVTDGVLRESEVIKEIVTRLEILEERAGYEVNEEESK
ncbi:helix-turn-helix domain-containing protein [Selenomonas ruminantium]|nr:helix-turn-helix transcriptional regulator [Selenomonas ruminantium]